MVETLFVQVLRSWLATSGQTPSDVGNWLIALKDERSGHAWSAIHARPDHPWTVAELAALAGTSRSAFAALFARTVGAAPLTDLTRWRMNLSAGYLEDGQTLKEVAEKVGCESGASYGKAFKAVMGVAPGEWRRKHALPASTTRPLRSGVHVALRGSTRTVAVGPPMRIHHEMVDPIDAVRRGNLARARNPHLVTGR